MDKETRQHRYLQGLGIAILILAVVRCAVPSVAPVTVAQKEPTDSLVALSETAEAEEPEMGETAAPEVAEAAEPASSHGYREAGSRPHRIRGVNSYQAEFPDSNSVQLAAAQRWGVKPVRDRQDAEDRKDELVYVGFSPYYHLAPLHASVPYLVPRAAVLLQDIGQAFFDSLQVKGVPLHRLIVTSVLRSQADVARLRQYNPNATENSCHLYGTTFDIAYNRYKTVQDPDGPRRRLVRDDTLKYVLSEVLRDMRRNGRCYIKYERKQGCFHMTVR